MKVIPVILSMICEGRGFSDIENIKEDKVYCSQLDWTRKEGRVIMEEGVMKVVDFNF